MKHLSYKECRILAGYLLSFKGHIFNVKDALGNSIDTNDICIWNLNQVKVNYCWCNVCRFSWFDIHNLLAVIFEVGDGSGIAMFELRLQYCGKETHIHPPWIYIYHDMIYGTRKVVKYMMNIFLINWFLNTTNIQNV